MNKQGLTIHHDITRGQSLLLYIVKTSDIETLILDVPDMNFMEAIEYSLSNLISSLWKKDIEKQW